MQAESILTAAAWLRSARCAVALSGAGVSTESGLPDFRSPDGLWSRLDPGLFEYRNFIKRPAEMWRTLRELRASSLGRLDQLSPNRGHLALAEMERLGLLKALITQNVDGLHQRAGSLNVIELHGNLRETRCQECGALLAIGVVLEGSELLPRCACGGILKPAAILFGEALDKEPYAAARALALNCDLMLVIGTSATVEPAASLPRLAHSHGARLIEVNRTAELDYAELSLTGEAGALLQNLLELSTGETQ